MEFQDDKCLKMGDFIVLYSIEEDEKAFLASSAAGEDSVVAHPGQKSRKCVFEILPMIHNSARKALQKSKAQGEELKRLREAAKKEVEDNEAIYAQMEGTPIRFGQIIQLSHPQSGIKYLTVSNSEAALLEHACAKLFFRSWTGKKCWFKFLPIEDGAREGGKINIGSVVTLAHANSDATYVHRSSWSDEQGDFEANAAPLATHWTTELFDTSGKRNAKAGGMVRLLHQKAGYLMASLIPKKKGDQKFQESVLFKNVPVQKREKPVRSTNTIWVIEMESSSVGTISSQTKVRFNLWGTNKYLCIRPGERDQKLAVALSSSRDPNTLFYLHKFDRKDPSKTVMLNSYISLQHVSTSNWLKGVPLIDQSKFWGVECSPKMSQSEVIRLIPVSQSQVALIGYLQKTRPALVAYIECLQQKKPLKKINSIQDTLIDLIQWVIDPPPPKDSPMINVGKPIKDRQYLLGSPAMLDLLVELVVLPFVGGYNTYQILDELPEFRFQCELVYWLLAKTTYRLPKVSARLFKYMHEFSKQVEARLPVYPLLEEIFRDNKGMSQMLEPTQLENFVYLMTSLMIRSSDFLDFLAKLCVCDGQAIVNNQDIICRSLLHENPNYFLQTKVDVSKGQEGKHPIYVSDDDGTTRMRLDEFLWSADRSLVKFHGSSLALFHSLCFGRNSGCIAAVEKFVTIEESLSAIMCAHLPFVLRTAYCEVLQYVYLDRHPHKEERIATVYTMRKASKNLFESDKSNTGDEKTAEIVDLEGDETEFRRVGFGETPRNIGEKRPSFVVEMELPEEDRAPMISPRKNQGLHSAIWSVFVEFFDTFFRGVVHPSSAFNQFFLALLRALKATLAFELFELKLNSGFHASMERALGFCIEKESALMAEGKENSNERAIMLDVKVEICEILEIDFLHQLNTRIKTLARKCIIEDSRVEEQIEKQIQAKRRVLESGHSRNITREKVLMELLYHQDTRLSGFSMRLLVSDVSKMIPAYENIAKKIQFLRTPQEMRIHDVVLNECVPSLNEAADSLVDCDLRNVIQRIKQLIDMCLREKHAPNQKHQDLLGQLGVHRAVIRLLESMPRDIRDRIVTLNTEEVSEFHPHQRPQDPARKQEAIQFKHIYTGCYIFLLNFCRQNSSNQKALFPNLELFVSHVHLDIFSEDAMVAIFTDNVSLCKKLAPQFVVSILKHIRKSQKTAAKSLKLLQTIAMPSGTSNRPIQSLILKQIVAQSADLCPFLDPDSCHHLIACSQNDDPFDVALVAYYSEMVNVLSACSFGKSHTAEAMCQNLLPLKAILETLENTRSLPLQSAFARFFDEVWLYTEIFVPQLLFLQSDPQLWAVFLMFSNQIGSYCGFLKSKVRGKTFVRTATIAAPGGVGKIKETSETFEITGDNVGEWTKYLCDYVVPLLEHFFDKHFRRESAQKNQMDIAVELYDGVFTMLRTKLKHKERVLKIISCLQVFLKHGLVDSQRANRFPSTKRSKLRDIKSNESIAKSISPSQDCVVGITDDGDYDAHSLIEFRLSEKDSVSVFPPLVRDHLSDETEKFNYAKILADIIKDAFIEDMELKLSCLRLLRYIAWNGDLDKIEDPEDWMHLERNQKKLASLGLVPNSLALLGPALDDQDICKEVLDLAMVLTFENKKVRDGLMDHYFEVAEEVIWSDLRALIQRSIAHIKKQKTKNRAVVEVEEVDEDDFGSFDESSMKRKKSVGGRRQSIFPLSGATIKDILLTDKEGAPEYHADIPVDQAEGSFPQLPYTTLVFKFMKTLCSDHNPMVQRYLRMQEDNYQNVDLVRESVLFLRTVDDFCNPDTVDVILKCICFMQDLAIGSRENQMDLVSYGVIESLDYLLKKNILTPFGYQYRPMELQIQVKASELLLTLLEGNLDTSIPTTMITHLNFHSLRYHAKYLNQEEVDEPKELPPIEKKKIDLARNIFRLLKMLGETDQSKVPDEFREGLDDAVRDLSSENSVIGRIEIVAADRSVQRLYFPVPQSCRSFDVIQLQSNLEDFLALGDVNWQSTTERVEELCMWFEEVLIQIEHKEALGTDNTIINKHIINFRVIWIYLALLFAVILNILVVSFADTSGGFRDDMDIVLRVLGIGELVLAGVILYGFMKLHGLPFHYKKWSKRYNQVYQRCRQTDPNFPAPSVLFSFRERDEYINHCLPYLRPPNLPNRTKFVMYSWYHYLLDVSIDGAMYQLIYVLVVLLGITVHPFFYCFLLLDIVRISTELRTVLLTVRLIVWTIFVIGLLILVMIWIFSLYVFLFIPEAFSPDNGMYCDYPLQCLIGLANVGISLAGQTIEFIAISPWSETGSFMGIVVFDIAFFIVVGMILFNIIFAVIVDKFGQLRDERAEISDDFVNRCFICSIEREVFQRKISESKTLGIGLQHSSKVFQDHVMYDHRIWDYLFFFQYLKEKTDPMTSNEEHVKRQIEQMRWLAFMPVGRAKILEDSETEDGETSEERLEAIGRSINAVTRLISRLHSKLDANKAARTAADKR